MNRLIDHMRIREGKIEFPKYRVTDGLYSVFAYEKEEVNGAILLIADTHYEFRDIEVYDLVPTEQLVSLAASIPPEAAASEELAAAYLRELCPDYDPNAAPDPYPCNERDTAELPLEERDRLEENRKRIFMTWLEVLDTKAEQERLAAIAAWEQEQAAQEQAQPTEGSAPEPAQEQAPQAVSAQPGEMSGEQDALPPAEQAAPASEPAPLDNAEFLQYLKDKYKLN